MEIIAVVRHTRKYKAGYIICHRCYHVSPCLSWECIAPYYFVHHNLLNRSVQWKSAEARLKYAHHTFYRAAYAEELEPRQRARHGVSKHTPLELRTTKWMQKTTPVAVVTKSWLKIFCTVFERILLSTNEIKFHESHWKHFIRIQTRYVVYLLHHGFCYRNIPQR